MEVLGLRWQDVDFSNDTIRICNTVIRVKTLIEQEQTKSRASKRTLFIIPDTKPYLLQFKQQQDEQRRLLGDAHSYNDHICVHPDGQQFKPGYVSHHFSLILKKNDRPSIRFHELRHTAGSLLLEKGLSAKQIQEYLGHEQISTTLDIYGYLSLEGKREASEKMNDLLNLEMR